MKKEIEASGKNRRLAVEKAVAQLGCSVDDVSVVVLQTETKGFFGFGAKPCVVKATYSDGIEESVKKEYAPLKKQPERVVLKEKPAIKKEMPASVPQEEKQIGNRKNKEEEAKSFLADVIQKMGMSVEIEVTATKDQMKINLTGSDMGIIIGRRGETLDALQYLTSLVVNKGEEGYIKVTLDTENYRQKREETLVRLATKLASKVVKYKRSISLEPMNPYERRIIHSALQEMAGITTYSTGTEPNRKVVIASANGERNKVPKTDEQTTAARPYEKRREGSNYENRPRTGGYSERNHYEEQKADGNSINTIPRTDEAVPKAFERQEEQSTGYKPTPVLGEKLAKASNIEE